MRKTLFAGVVLLFASGAFADSYDLSGRVFAPNEQPMHGATVYVYTAKVKEGTNPLCPSCYADCAKRALTDAAGRFTISSLDEKLRFKILVVAEGYAPTFVVDVDPVDGEMVATLESIPENRLLPEFGIRGRIVDPLGLPIIGATIEFRNISVPALERKMQKAISDLRHLEDRQEFNRLLYEQMADFVHDEDKIDALAVTNEAGEYVLTSEYFDATYEVKIGARGFADERFSNLRAGKRVHEGKLNYGVTASGSVAGSDLALGKLLIGVVQVDRGATFVGEYVVGVNDDGRFEIPNLPPHQDYYVYGKMESLQGIGIVASQKFQAGGHDSRVNVGTLNIEPGIYVSGRVVLPEGSPIPAQTHIMFSRGGAWDTLSSVLGEDGSFEASTLPVGRYSLSLRIPGYHLSDQNYSRDPMSPYLLSGVIEEDVSDLEILMELGDLEHGLPTYNEALVERRRRLKTEPIRGYNSD